MLRSLRQRINRKTELNHKQQSIVLRNIGKLEEDTKKHKQDQAHMKKMKDDAFGQIADVKVDLLSLKEQVDNDQASNDIFQ